MVNSLSARCESGCSAKSPVTESSERASVANSPAAIRRNSSSSPAVRGAGEEPEVAGVDTQDGNRSSAEPVYAFEQRAVAAVADHDRLFGSRQREPLTVDMLCGGGCSCELTHDWDELSFMAYSDPKRRIASNSRRISSAVRATCGREKSMIFIGGVSKK